MAPRATPRTLKRQTAKKVAQYLVNGSAALEDSLTNSKPWYASKTLWVNLLALLALLVQSYTGFVVDGEIQAALLVVVNLVLRAMTGKPIAARDKATMKKAAVGGGAATLLVLVGMLLGGCATLSALLQPDEPRVCDKAELLLDNGATTGTTRMSITCDGQSVLKLDASGLLLSGQMSIDGPVDPDQFEVGE